MDIICHGVPSQKFLKEEAFRHTTNIDRVDFRNKKFKQYTFAIDKNGEIVYSQNWIKNPYFYTFMKSLTCRENCYTCRYASSSRCSDITVGDFWGLSKESKFYTEKEKGVSVVLPITNKGLKLIDEVSDFIEKEERPVEEAINGNSQLRNPVVKNRKVDKFKKIYTKKQDFFLTYKKICYMNIIKQKIKSNEIIHNIMEKLGEKDG